MPLSAQSFVDANRDRLLEELFEFLRIPSVSTLPEHRDDVRRAAQFVASRLGDAGMEHVEIIPTEGHPLVYADWLHAPGKPTLLCYGHYDVQPPDPLDQWVTAPFEPAVRNGSIYARGSADDKGQMYIHIKAMEALRSLYGKLPVNVKFLIEGEEEVGGKSIARFVPENKRKLAAGVALVSDTAMFQANMPTLCIGLRGLIYMEWEASGPSRDLHSGLYGGAAPNAIFGLIELLSKAKDASGVIRIPGIYDDVKKPAPAELESWARLPFDEKEFLAKEVGSTCLTGEKGYSVFERTWARPTFEVHGIAGGFTSPGAKTVIPAKATAKVSIRLVPDQNPERVIEQVRNFVRTNAPAGVRVEVRVLSAAPATIVNPDHRAIRLAAQALTEVFGQPTVFVRSGGSIPIVGDFAQRLGIPTVLMGFGLPDDGLHSPNEKFSLENYYKGILSVVHFVEKLAA
ncbi:MAG TPA: dipeptidase [Bryobacterales bacterium]|nr:dipeptidase [Bryobacterales bacterium]